MRDLSQKVVIEKASQMGVSTYGILWIFWLCKYKIVKKGTVYWMPTRGAINDHVAGKVDPLLAENPDVLWSATSRKETDNRGLKFLYGIPTYWRGLESKVNVKAISADAAIYDELDEANQSQKKQAEQRLSASDFKLEREFSTPTLPDFGIDASFQRTDQSHAAFRCTGCFSWNILEEYFPNCFRQNKDGDYYHACKKCHGKLDITKLQFIQKQRSPLRGYHISQLYSQMVSPNEIMNDYQTTQFIGHFHNHVLGLPYLSATDRVTEEQILALCDNTKPMQASCSFPCAMGVDVGSKLNVVIITAGIQRVVWVGEVNEFSDVDRLAKAFNVRVTVFDALPEQRKVREYLKAHWHGKSWMCFYNDNQKGEPAWDETEYKVLVNRTESLDAGTLALLDGKFTLPQRNKDLEVFAKQCENIAKIVDEDEITGSKKYIYKKIGPDHYRHALNYAMLASSKAKVGNIISVFR